MLAEPTAKAWELFRFRLVAPLDSKRFSHFSSRTGEIAYRALFCLGASLSVVVCPVYTFGSLAALGIGRLMLRAIGFSLQKDGYTYVKGDAPEKAIGSQLKLMTWNVCGIFGGMTYDHGGVNGWRARLDGIVARIESEDPDVLILQEIYDTALGEALIAKLKLSYSHFFTHLGPNILGSESGVMILSKCAIHKFSFEGFDTNPWMIHRGFGMLEVKAKPKDAAPCLRVIGTHLIYGYNKPDVVNRMKQVSQIVERIARKKLPLPTVLAGDFNIERDQKEGQFFSNFVRNGYLGAEHTCTEKLMAQWYCKPMGPERMIDNISFMKSTTDDGRQIRSVKESAQIADCHLVRAFDNNYDTKTALSDHHGIAASILMGTVAQ